MPRQTPTPDLIENILARIPEGFIRYDQLCQRIEMDRSTAPGLLGGSIARDGEYWYDASRLTPDDLRERRAWAKTTFPDMNSRGIFLEDPIAQRTTERNAFVEQLPDRPSAEYILQTLAAGRGYSSVEALVEKTEEKTALQHLLQRQWLKQMEELIYDPLRLSPRTMKLIAAQEKLAPDRQRVIEFLEAQPGRTASQVDLSAEFGPSVINDLLSTFGDFKLFHIQNTRRPQNDISWIRLSTADHKLAKEVATESSRISWEKVLAKAGNMLRPGAKDGNDTRLKVQARTYTLGNAAKRLGIRQKTLEQAMHDGRMSGFEDPEGVVRLPVDSIEAAVENSEYAEQITAYEIVTARDIALVCNMSYSTVRRKLQKIGITRNEPRWGQVRGHWDLPDTYREFQDILQDQLAHWQAQREVELRETQEKIEAERHGENERRAELRAKLVAAFPTWQHDERANQCIMLHVGPPNSGKTHDALDALAKAGSGWYLAPLRLLAFEIFDRLNQRGIPCNLLTGEEHIPVEGAQITAATVEMFDPRKSGECVIIDEAQMLADPDRGWAWTRAVMEAQAPFIHVIGPPTVRSLIERMATAGAVPLEVIEHNRLAPIQIAENNWPLHQIPSRTILVAFSRQMVLHLKTELEKMRRSVSVVYGNLPPEVRRKQADRFANGETEICVATDAVGMGLNLPADYVCFYEVEKFDGRNIRFLTAAEVHQIGGRAGRFGISTGGMIGAISKRDLKVVAELYNSPAEELTRARVAPTVEDLELIPGTLASKLTQWGSLESIPEGLRSAIQTADMSERIELANMLTDREVKLLGLAAALKLVNAPTRQNTREFWYRCARSILTDKPMPLPPTAPREINDTIELEAIEFSIACADIYLWLSHRPEFSNFAGYETEVREMRGEWSTRIDDALLRKINTTKRCSRCGTPLPLKHRFSVCNDCFYKRRREYREDAYS